MALDQMRQLARKDWITFYEVQQGNLEEVFVSFFV